jgi:hypothetical protein
LFENEYKPVLEFTSIYHRNRIYNIDKKGARITCLTGEEVIILIRIKKIYIGILQNYFSITVVKYISANRKVILLLVIIPGVMIIKTWFHEKIIRHKFIIISLSSYTNKGICMFWLDYFIKYNNYSLV